MVITNKNADGTEIHQATTTVSIDGLTRSVGTDMDSDAVANCFNSQALVNSEVRIGEAANNNCQQLRWRMVS